MKKIGLLVIPFVLSINGYAQKRCYNCFVFQGDSISIDSSLNFSLPFIYDPEKFSQLPDGLWASLFVEGVYSIVEIKDGKVNGRAIQFGNSVTAKNPKDADVFSEYQFANNKATGKYVRWWSFSKNIPRETGHYVNGRQDSVWTNYYAKFANYSLYSTEFYKNGELEGTQKYYYPNGKLQSIKEYISGIPCGNETAYFSNGQIYLERVYLCTHPPQYISDNFNYINTYTPDGKPLVIRGNGIHKIYDEKTEKVVQSGPVVNGKRHGEWKSYGSGVVVITIYENGLKK